MFGSVVAGAFQIAFHAEMHTNDVFLFFKNHFWYQHIKTIQKIQTALNFNKKKNQISTKYRYKRNTKRLWIIDDGCFCQSFHCLFVDLKGIIYSLVALMNLLMGFSGLIWSSIQPLRKKRLLRPIRPCRNILLHKKTSWASRAKSLSKVKWFFYFYFYF